MTTIEPTSDYIFEVKDASNDEMYYTCGIYFTLEKAIEAAIDDEPHIECEYDHAIIKIEKRIVNQWNWACTGKTVATIEWVRDIEWEWGKPMISYFDKNMKTEQIIKTLQKYTD